MFTLSRICRSCTCFPVLRIALIVSALLPAAAVAQLFDTIEGPDPNSTTVRSSIFENEPIFSSGFEDFVVSDSSSTWIRHVGGGGPGWQPYTSVGGALPLFADNGAWIFEAQGLVTNNGNGGASVGVTRRFFLGNNLLGAGFSYDVNQSPNGNVFRQTVFSVELIRDDWTFRSNGYLPTGPRVRNVVNSAVAGGGADLQFQGNGLVGSGFDSFRLDETAMRGIDVEIARSVGTWSGEIFVGYYNFQGKIGGDVDGIKGGVRGYVTPRLSGNVTISDDPLFGTNVYGGFTWFLGGAGGNAPRTIEDKLTIPVERNQQVVINEVGSDSGGPIFLTSGGNPISFTHIDTNAGGANLGTFENPFLSLPPTQNSDIVYVHADGTYLNQSYNLNPNQRFLGEGNGNNHVLNTDQLGQILVPGGNFGLNRPLVQAVNGQFALNSAANTEISNFDIDNSGPGLRAGIFGNTGDVNVNRTLITGGFTGIDIIGGTGQFMFTDVAVTDPTDAGLSVNGGTSGLTFDPNSSITQTTGGTAVRVNGGHTGNIRFDGDINATNGDGLQFDDAAGQYDFRGQVQLNGGDAGIDILGGSAGTFTFTDTTITNPTGTGLNVDGGSSTIIFDGLSSITKNNGGSTIRVQGGHTGGLTFDPDTGLEVTGAGAGDGLQFDNADGQYDFRGQVQLNGGDAGIDILGDSAGTFTFTDTTITNPTGTGLNVDGGSSTIIFDGLSSITKNNGGSTIRVQGGHTGGLTFDPDTGLEVTGAGAGDGLQFDNADGQYDFRGQVQLNGGDAGIDILGDSAGTFTFTDTTITNPTGEGLNVDGGSSTIIFDGFSSITKNNGGSTVRVQGGHSGGLTFDPDTGLEVTGAGAGDGLQFDNADGEYDFRGQVQLNGGNAGIDILGDSAGTFTFTDTTITNPTGEGLNVDGGSSTIIFDGFSSITKNNGGSTVRVQGGHSGGLTFDPDTGLEVTGAGAGDGLQFDNADGQYDFRGQIQLDGGNAGIDILGGSAGTFTFTDTTISNTAADGIVIDDSSGTFTFSNVNINATGGSGLSFGALFGNPGTVNFTDGMISNTGTNGVTANNTGVLNLNNTTFNNITGFTTDLTGSTVSGTGNVAAPFSSNNGGGNTGTILFNGGVDTAP